MKKERKLALIDMDGTTVDYHTVLLKDMAALAAPEENYHPDCLYGNKLPSWLFRRKQLITKQPGWWLNLPKLQAGFDLLWMCQDLGFEMMVLTKGPLLVDNAWIEKLQWCKKNLPDIQVAITTDKSVVYGRVLIDDYPDYALDWLKWRPRGLVIMPKSNACKGFKHKNVFIYDGSPEAKIEAMKKLTYAYNRGT